MPIAERSRLDARRMLAVNAAKLTGLASRALRRGGGTALPGIVATGVDPSITSSLADQLQMGSLVVAGTNGKTTTARFLASIVADAGYVPIRNESGSNLLRGVATSLVRHAGATGNLVTGERTVGLFEVDEAALPEVAIRLRPKHVLLLNLFRDQLDRYGEVATVARLWTAALARLPSTSSVVVNADDPLLVHTTADSKAQATFFGVSAGVGGAAHPGHASDIKACPHCGSQIEYTRVFLGHLGHYRCTVCKFSRPEPVVVAENIDLLGFNGSTFDIAIRTERVAVRLQLPGLYNVYNALAAAAAAHSLGIPLPGIAASLGRTTAAFGRMERIGIKGRTLYLALAKNPTGLNEVVRTVRESGTHLHLLMMLNDNTADGRDVSWIWDADVETLAGSVQSVTFGGGRAYDMALRFKYAGVLANEDIDWEVQPTASGALQHAIERTPPGETLFVIPTYTAMLEVRHVLTEGGYVARYWKDEQ